MKRFGLSQCCLLASALLGAACAADSRHTVALTGATRVAASCLGMAQVGTLEAGNWADLLVLGSNPLVDITATRTLEKVFIAGNDVR